MNFASLILEPAGLPLEKRLRRALFLQFQMLGMVSIRSQLVGAGIPDAVTVISDGDMLFELMKTNLHGLASIVEETGCDIPMAVTSNTLQGLGPRKSLLVAHSTPQAHVVIVTAGLIGFVGLHLRFSEVLVASKTVGPIKADDILVCYLN